MGGTEVSSLLLHTDSENADNVVEVFNISDPTNLILSSQTHLLGAEQRLYAWLHTSNYNDFITKLRELFNESGNVKEIFANFKKQALTQSLGLPENVILKDQKITIICDPSPGVNLQELLNKIKFNNGSISGQVNGGQLELTFQYNANNIKDILNELQQRSKKNKLQSNTESLTTANKAFRQLIKNQQIGEVVINKGSSKPITITDKLQTTGDINLMKNFSYTKKSISEALQDANLKQQLITARQNVYNTLKKLCMNHPIIEQIFDNEWTNKMGKISSNDNATLEKFIFLSKGGNLNAGVSGAIQELYAAMLGEYIGYLSGKVAPQISNILGNVIQGKTEQPKTDVSILNSIGIQVKAYSMDNEYKIMESNLHPGALQASLSQFNINNVADTIVQAVFNSSNGDYQDLADKLEPAMAQLMNLNAQDNVSDTVCFYVVDAQYLVPGSEILSHFTLNKPKISITSSFKTRSDEEYKTDKTYKREDNTMAPEFVRYWNGYHAENSTDLNEQTYENLLNKNISIRVDFDYAFMGSKRYAMY